MEFDNDCLWGIINLAPFNIFLFDRDLKFSTSNTAHQNNFGIKNENLTGRDMHHCGKVSGIDKNNIDLITKTMVSTKESLNISYNLIASDPAINPDHYFATWHFPIIKNKKFHGLCGISIDLSAILSAFSIINSQLILSKSFLEMIHSLEMAVKKYSIALDKTSNHEELSRQEINCIKLLAKGMNSTEIGDILKLSKRTVEHYIDHAKNKLFARNSAELVFKCVKMGIL